MEGQKGCALVLVLLKLSLGELAVREELGKADGRRLGLLELFLLALLLFLLFLALACMSGKCGMKYTYQCQNPE